MSKTNKKPKQSRNIRTWIRQRISPFCFGTKAKAGHPVHCNRNDDILFHYQCLKMGWYGRRLSRLTNSDMTEHFSGRETYYFTADGRSATNEVLANIDIDCHEFGSLAGAIAFAEHLKATRFPGLYYEVSTNGNGVHGFIVVIKGDLGDEGLNAALSRLDKWLKAELAKGCWDVEAVEVKGHCSEFTWGQAKCELKTYKSGQLAKLPREALLRADELRTTTRLTVQELRKLPVPAADESEASVVRRAKKATKKTSAVSVSESENWEESSVVFEKVKKTKCGSIEGHHFGPDELARLGGGYLSLARELIGDKKLVASGRRVVTEEDLAVFLMLIRFFTQNMNGDGSLPVARWREMWTALHGAGDVSRAWCHHRFATMRNFFSDGSWLSWDDESFVVGVYDEDGRFVPGRASKWQAGEELMRKLEAVGVGGGEVASEVGGVQAVGEKKEEKSTLYGNNNIKTHNDDLVTDQDDPSEAFMKAQTTPPNPNQGQSTSFQKFLDDFGIWTPIPRPRFAGYSTGNYRMAA